MQIFAENVKETKLLFKSKLTTSANSSTGMEVSFDDAGIDRETTTTKKGCTFSMTLVLHDQLSKKKWLGVGVWCGGGTLMFQN